MKRLISFRPLFSRFPAKRISYSRNIFEEYPSAKLPADKLKQGISLMGEGKFLEARQTLDSSVYDLSKILPENHLLMAIAYNNLAEACRMSPTTNSSHHFADIESLYLNSLNIWLKQMDRQYFENIAVITANYSVWLLQQSRNEDALKMLHKSLHYRNEMKNDGNTENFIRIGILHCNIASAQVNLGNYEEAKKSLQESGDILNKYLTPSHPEFLKYLYNAGIAFFQMNESNQAKMMFQQLIKSSSGTQLPLEITLEDVIAKLSEIFNREGNFIDGIAFLKSLEKLSFKEETMGVIYAYITVMLSNSKGDPIEMKNYARKAATIAMKNAGSSTSFLMNSIVESVKKKIQ